MHFSLGMMSYKNYFMMYYYIGIALYILAFITVIGYIILLTNTAKMQDNKNMSELYYLNVASSVLYGLSIGILIPLISKYFRA
jgi:hypothetical protein